MVSLTISENDDNVIFSLSFKFSVVIIHTNDNVDQIYLYISFDYGFDKEKLYKSPDPDGADFADSLDKSIERML